MAAFVSNNDFISEIVNPTHSDEIEQESRTTSGSIIIFRIIVPVLYQMNVFERLFNHYRS